MTNQQNTTVVNPKFDRSAFEVLSSIDILNRNLVFGKLENSLVLRFGKNWQSSKEEYTKIMSLRKLHITNWNIHPLL